MSNISDDIKTTIIEKIKTAKAINGSFKGAAGRALRAGVAEPMTVYRTNVRSIQKAEAQFLNNAEENKPAVNE